jgi:hypothetical protein
MDAYLEDEALWAEFHRLLVAALHDALFAALAGRYELVIGHRHYPTTFSQSAEEHQEDFLEIRGMSDGGLVTLLDVVSPANKTTATGRQAYLEQRRNARDRGASLVEIDLVLQGQPTLDYSREGLPPWNYAVTVTRSTHPDRFEIYTATLAKRLPRFRVPLDSDDRDVVLDLQSAFTGCFARGGYSERIDYRRDPPVPLTEEDRRWLDVTLTAQKLREHPLPVEQVALTAYYIWKQEGCPHGRDKEHWYQALAQLREQKGTGPEAFQGGT